MLMSMTILNDTVKLLSNINNGTNTLVINNSIVPEYSWVGTGYYTVGNIRIAKISANSGNIHLIKVNDLNYKLVVKTNTSTIWAENVQYDNTVSGSAEDNVQDAIDDLYDKLDDMHPVGSVFLTVSNTNPSVWFGGTWERIGKGRTIVGVDENDTDFNAAEKTGGSKTNTLVVDQVPSHRHSIPVLSGTAASTGSGHYHSIYTARPYGASVGSVDDTNKMARTAYNADGVAYRYTGTNGTGSNEGAHSHSVTTTASNTGYTGGNASAITQPVNNLQPFIAIYIWKRTA